MSSSLNPLEFAPGVFRALTGDLCVRGAGQREAGAFLLAGTGERVVRRWLPYDELAPESLAFDYVRLEPAAFSRLWEWCAMNRYEVLADVHTHPGGPRQSPSDRAHPMVALPGHRALIVPWFAQRNPRPFDCSLNVYLGDACWKSYFHRDAERLIVAP